MLTLHSVTALTIFCTSLTSRSKPLSTVRLFSLRAFATIDITSAAQLVCLPHGLTARSSVPFSGLSVIPAHPIVLGLDSHGIMTELFVATYTAVQILCVESEILGWCVTCGRRFSGGREGLGQGLLTVPGLTDDVPQPEEILLTEE